jgi:pimeloyl-ACP methyl ester carboxylesterase
MPAVFVHGVPDTHRVWNTLLPRITRKDVVAPSLPGFDATTEAYVDWLLGELARQSGPIDLVGHDWGALLVTRAVSLRPGAVRSWAVGAAPLVAARAAGRRGRRAPSFLVVSRR